VETCPLQKEYEILVISLPNACAYPRTMVVYIFKIVYNYLLPCTSTQILHLEQWKALGGLSILHDLQ